MIIFIITNLQKKAHHNSLDHKVKSCIVTPTVPDPKIFHQLPQKTKAQDGPTQTGHIKVVFTNLHRLFIPQSFRKQDEPDAGEESLDSTLNQWSVMTGALGIDDPASPERTPTVCLYQNQQLALFKCSDIRVKKAKMDERGAEIRWDPGWSSVQHCRHTAQGTGGK